MRRQEDLVKRGVRYAYTHVLPNAERDLGDDNLYGLVTAIACGLACCEMSPNRERTHELIDLLWDFIEWEPKGNNNETTH